MTRSMCSWPCMQQNYGKRFRFRFRREEGGEVSEDIQICLSMILKGPFFSCIGLIMFG